MTNPKKTKICVFCAANKKPCPSACPTKEVSTDITGLAVQDLKPLMDFFSTKFVKACFLAAILEVKTKTVTKVLHDHHLIGVKKGLRWEYNLWLQQPTAGPLSVMFPYGVNVAFTSDEVAYLKGILPEDKEATSVELENTLLPGSTEMKDPMIVDLEKNVELEKIMESEESVEEKASSLQKALLLKETNYELLKKHFPKITLNKFLDASGGDLKLQNQILESLMWETEAWKDHPLKGPQALCDLQTVASSSVLDPQSKENLFSEFEEELLLTRMDINSSSRRLEKMEGIFARLRSLHEE